MKLNFFDKNASFEDTFFFIPKLSLSFLGYWPQQPGGVSITIKKTINFILLFMSTFTQLLFGYVHIKDLLLALDAICPALTELVTLIKLLTFWIFKNSLKVSIDRLHTITKEAVQMPEKLKIYRRSNYTATIVAGGVWLFSNLTNISYSLRPLINVALVFHKTGNVTVEMPFRAQLPQYLTLELPYYPITFIILSYTGVITVFGFSGVDGFLLGYCHYISMMFQSIQIDIRETFSNLESKDFEATPQDNIVYREKLRKIVIMQNELNKICKQFTRVYISIIISHFLSSAIIMGLSLLDMMMNNEFGIVLYVCYSSAVLVQLLTYCLGGSTVMESSSNLASALYGVAWYKCNKSTQKMILLIIMRAQEPTNIAVPFFSPSMEVFGTVLSSVGSYVTLLKTFL